MKKLFALVLLAVTALFSSEAHAQSGCSYIAPGAILTSAQWNFCFSSKLDNPGFTPLNPSNVVGVPPITVTPSGGVLDIACPTCTTGGSGSFAATAPVAVTFPSGIVTYALNLGTGLSLGGGNLNISNTAVTAGTYGSATQSPQFTVNAQGQLTSAAGITITPAIGSVTGLGTGVSTALGLNTNATGGFPTVPVGFAQGGCNATTQAGCTNNIFPTPTRAGDIAYWNGSAWVTLAGNNSGTNILSENASGLPAWLAPTNLGLVNSVSNSDGSLTISPTTGAVVASLNPAHANTWTATQTYNPASGTGIVINPLAASVNQGFNITQSGPTTGSVTATVGLNFNQIILSGYNYTTTCANNTDPFANFGYWCNAVSLFKAGMIVGGANVSAGPGAAGGTIAPVVGHIINTTPMTTINDLVGVAGIAYSNSTNSGTGGLFGGASAVVCDGCVWNQVSGYEIDVGFKNAPTVPIRTGLDIVAQGSTSRGSAIDTILWFVSSNGTGNFNRMITLGGGPPLSTAADMFVSDTALTINNVFNFAGACNGASPGFGPCNVTVTGKILNFPFVSIAGSGVSTFGSPNNSTGTVLLGPVADGTASGTNVSVSNAAAANTFGGGGTWLFMAANEASRTTVRYGLIIGNYAEIGAFNSGALGLIVGTNTNIPLIFGTNNTFAGGISGSQQWNAGPAVALQTNTKFTLNFNTVAPLGYQSGTRAPLQIVGVDTVNNLALMDTFSTANNQSLFTFRRARGTGASPAVVQNGDNLGGIGFVGAVSASAFASESGAAGGAFIVAQATETWSATNQGTKLLVYTTPTTTNAIAIAATFYASGGFAVGSAAADPGAGIINVTTGYRIGNVAASGHYLRGNGTNYVDATLGAGDLTGQVAVANGGTACASASITCFNNITGFSATGTTGTTSTNLVFSTSPTLVTPALGVATGTSLALGGGSIGSDALEVTGTTTHNGGVTVAGAPFTVSGNQSVAAWTTNGVRIKGVTGTLTDTTSSGTVAAAYTDVLGGNTIAASSATTYTNYFSFYAKAPVQGTNVTFTNAWALGGDSLRVGTSNQFTVSTTGHVTIEGVTSSGATGAGNVVFGTSPMLTTPTFVTSATGPLLIGGTAAGSALELRSTSGTGSGDKVSIRGGTNGGTVLATFYGSAGTISIGPNGVAPLNTAMLLSTNTTQVSGSLGSGANAVVQIVGTDGVQPIMAMNSFGTNVAPQFSATVARGTAATPTTLVAGDAFFSFGGYAYDGTNYDLGGAITFIATAITANTNASGAIRFLGVNANALHAAWITNNAGLMLNDNLTYNSALDPGAGGLYVGGQQFNPNITTTSAAQTGTVCWTTGTGKFTADTTLGCLTSSEKYKEQIKAMRPEDCLKIVMRLETVSFFKRKEYGGNLDPAEQIGFRAEQVEQVDRRLTASDQDGQVRGVRYQQDSAIYACAFQALKADNDSLRADMEQLRKAANQ